MKFHFLIWLSALSFCHGRRKATPAAVVQITPGYSSGVTGELVVKATATGVTVTGQIRGLTPGLHGIHVHEFPDLANGCRNAGGHFDPFDEPHGDPRDLRRHVGDFGNIVADDHGIAHVHVVNPQASLDPHSKAYIGNLSLVVYGGEDDLGRSDHPDSLLTGNAGARVGCGLIVVQKQQQQPQQQQVKTIPEALVRMVPGNAPDLGGELRIRPTENGIHILGQITGLTPGEHGFHIHAIGDLGNKCKDAGGHYNPFGVNHGAPDDAVRHVGDLGNILADDTGTSYLDITDVVASLDPSSPAYIGDLSIVVHAGKDDLGRGGNPGSLKTGNAGSRSGCGIIEIQESHPIPDISVISQQKQDLELIEMHEEPQTASISEITVLEKEQVLSVWHQSPQHKTVARVQMIPGSAQDLAGHLTITSSPVAGINIEGQITGLTPGLHGFHIHEKGDLGNGCKNAGGHFNPFGAQHGAPEDTVRHVGDLGNIQADDTGKADINIAHLVASLDSQSQAYIGGLSFVVHAGEDDLGKGGNPGSLKTGNAGARSGCGLIVVDQAQQTQQQNKHNQRKQRTVSVESARVAMIPGNNPRLEGNLAIKTTPTGVLITGQITGLIPGLHGFHIHEKGDLGNGCKNAGGHFNPFGTQHGAPEDAVRHVGDLGNILADDTGKADINITDSMSSLDPHSEAYIGGLSFVVHAGEDDLGKGGNPGSLKTGNAGGRAGCGIIEVNELFKPITFPNPDFRFRNDDFGVVQIVPGSNVAASGELTINPRKGGIAIRGFITGLQPGLHGFHIHEKGDLGNGCRNAGGHFNPLGANHGGPEDTERHVGDLGNILADDSGTAYVNINDNVASMNPLSEVYIGNLSVVIHGGEDDLGRGGDPGSLKTGNAGGREACGFIRVETLQNKESEIRQTSTILDAAVVRLAAGQASNLSGELSFVPTPKGVHITGQIAGLPPGTHKLRLQPTVDFTNGCTYSTGDSNPGGSPRDRQVGSDTVNRELGSIVADDPGTMVLNIVDTLISLDPSSQAYIGNMSVVIEREDTGSLEPGDVAPLLGCGTIPHLEEQAQVKPVQEQRHLDTSRRRKRRFIPADLIVPYPDPFHTAPSGHYEESGKEAIVKITPGNSSTVHGNLNIKDVHTGLLIKGVIKGLSSGLHGFHIHERGSLGNKCQDAGGHFNPFEADHGDVTDFERHVGDLGNIKADAKGVAHIHIFDPKGSLDPHSQAFVGHRAVVVHANPDDLGRGKNEDSKRTGNSGTRLGCGIVTPVDKKGTHHNHHHIPHGHGHHQPHGHAHLHNQQPQHGYSTQRHLHDQPQQGHGHTHHQQAKHGHAHLQQAQHGHAQQQQQLPQGYGHVHHQQAQRGHAHHQQPQHGHAHHQQPQHGHVHHQQVQHQAPHYSSKHGNVQLHPGHSKPHHRVHHSRNVDLHHHKPSFNPFPEHPSFFHHGSPTSHYDKHEKVAHVKVIPGNSTHVHGNIEIVDVHTGLIVKGVIKGLSSGLHGFHIHERGGLGNKCQDAGGHFNPFEADHGDVTDFERHVGDLGNIKADANGVAHIHIFDPKGSLDPHSQAFVGHRAVVVHANPDDLGRGKNEDSKRTGNSGTRLGCGIITPIDKKETHHHHPPHRGHSSNFHVLHSRQTQTQPFQHSQLLPIAGYEIKSKNKHHDVPVYHRKKHQLALEKPAYGPSRGYSTIKVQYF